MTTDSPPVAVCTNCGDITYSVDGLTFSAAGSPAANAAGAFTEARLAIVIGPNAMRVMVPVKLRMVEVAPRVRVHHGASSVIVGNGNFKLGYGANVEQPR
jgi:hypothetical protein